MKLTTKRFASGKWFVYMDDSRIPGCIIGGNGRYALEVAGRTIGYYGTITEAARIAWQLEQKRWQEDVYVDAANALKEEIANGSK